MRRARTNAALASAILSAKPALQQVTGDGTRVTVPPSPDRPPVTVEAASVLELGAWVRANHAWILSALSSHGAILFRGFEVGSTESFADVTDAVAGARMLYTNRSSPRTTVGDRVYTSTDYPSHLAIFPHNEHSYSPAFPLYLFFCCVEAARSGGATPLGSTRRIGESIDPAVRRRFRDQQIMYVRNYHEGFGLPWQVAFQTSERAEAERQCQDRGVQWEWRDNGVLRTRRIGPAEVRHPRTGETLWFNHATFYHVSTLPAVIREELLADFDEEDLPNHTYYGDGSPIEADVAEHLREAYASSMRRFEWCTSDVLAVDNMLTVHAREPFTGTRRVLVSMAEEVRVP